MWGELGPPVLAWAHPRIAEAGPQEPAENPTVSRGRTAQKGLDGSKKVIDGARSACASPPVTGSCVLWGLTTFQHIQELWVCKHFARQMILGDLKPRQFRA